MINAATLAPGLASVQGYQMPAYPPSSSSLPEALTDPLRRLLVKVKSRWEEPEWAVSIPSWVGPAVERFDELASLPLDWDSYGGRPPTLLRISQAIEVLSEVMDNDSELPWIVPLPSGGIQMEWHDLPEEIEIAIDGSESAICIGDDEATASSPEWAFAMARLRDAIRTS